MNPVDTALSGEAVALLLLSGLTGCPVFFTDIDHSRSLETEATMIIFLAIYVLCLAVSSFVSFTPAAKAGRMEQRKRAKTVSHIAFLLLFFSPFTALAFWQNKAQNAKHKFGNSFLFLEKKNIQKRETNRKKRRENTDWSFPPKDEGKKSEAASPDDRTHFVYFSPGR